MSDGTLEFWFDFASTYSYLSASRIDSLARSKSKKVTWHPFLLGPIFKNQGWNNSPFNIYKAKGDYMWRDMERCAADYGLPFVPNFQNFPANSLLAARVALCFKTEERRGQFTKAVFKAEFAQGRDIFEQSTIAEILIGLELEPDPFFDQASSPEIKEKLFENTATASTKGIFGAPSFIAADGELFWGDDRLEQALNWNPK